MMVHPRFELMVCGGDGREVSVKVWGDKPIEWYRDLQPYGDVRRKLLELGEREHAIRCDEVLVVCLN